MDIFEVNLSIMQCYRDNVKNVGNVYFSSSSKLMIVKKLTSLWMTLIARRRNNFKHATGLKLD